MDYAACAGGFAGAQNVPNGVENGGGPAFGDTAAISTFLSSANACDDRANSHYATGIIYQRSAVTLKQVPDGLSKTYAVGEKFLLVDQYGTGSDPADNEWMFVGYDNDTNRSCTDIGDGINSNVMRDDRSATVINGQDLGGSGLGRNLWGSAHPSAFNMVFCDGSVHTVPYNVDLKTHRRLGNRMDGQTPVFNF